MRFLILKDNKISNDEMDELENEFVDFIYEHTGLTPIFYIRSLDYKDVPTEPDQDGDLKPTKAYVTTLMEDVYSQYGEWGVDSVVLLVHRDNWVFTGIWGTNWSNVYHSYHVHLCRFDSKNLANSLGTLYHEWMHSNDALIKTTLGEDVPFSVPYDKFIVHGGRPDKEKTTEWVYIRHKDNVKALKALAPQLQRAYNQRRAFYLEPYRKVQQKVLTWLRSYLNRKNGVPRSK